MSRVLDEWEKTIVRAASHLRTVDAHVTPEAVVGWIGPNASVERVAATLTVLRALRQLPTERSPLRVVP